MSKVAIIILNWNGWRDTIECLESLARIDYPSFQIIVVDNGSTDGSPEKIGEWVESRRLPVILLRSESNLGFARANNRGIRHALSPGDIEYLLILNNDTTVEKSFLTPLVACLNGNPKAALAAPQVKDYYRKTFWQKPIPERLNLITYILFATQLYRFASKLIAMDMERPSKIYVAPGCCLLLKSEAFERIGLFDEHTFLGWEEYIVGERLRQNGYDSYFVPDSVIYHKVGKSTDEIGGREKMRIFLESERYYQEKIMGYDSGRRLIIRLVRFIIYGLLRVMRGTGI